MNHEVIGAHEQREWDDQQQLDWRCRPLQGMDAELVEWTLAPARSEGKCVAAEVLLTDPQQPLLQLAALLRRIADEVDRLHRPRGPAAQLGVVNRASDRGRNAA